MKAKKESFRKNYIYCKKCKFTIYDRKSVEQNICFYCREKLDDSKEIKLPENEKKIIQGTIF